METTPTIEEATNNWLAAVNQTILLPQVNQHWIDRGHSGYCILVPDEINRPGQMFLRIVMEHYNGRAGNSCWAFVALLDGSNKDLGEWKAGDIFRPSGWKVPARHPRGNVFDLSEGPTCGIRQWTGPDYLKRGRKKA